MTRLLVSVLLVLFALAMSLDLRAVAAAMEPVATAEPVKSCPEWRKAGGQMIYKCVDEDAMVNCYAPAGGVMQCVPWQ